MTQYKAILSDREAIGNKKETVWKSSETEAMQIASGIQDVYPELKLTQVTIIQREEPK